MSPAIAAFLKKAAATLLTDKKVLKTVCGIILGIVIIIFIPIFTILAIFDGIQQFSMLQVIQSAVDYLDSDEKAKIDHVDKIMEDIEKEMTKQGFTGTRIDEAQIIFNTNLYEQSYESGFVKKLVGCFTENQTDAQLIANVNSKFGVTISVTDFTNIMGPIRAAYIDYSTYTDPYTKNNKDLVQWAIHAKNKGWGYVWGTYGKIMDEVLLQAKMEQYPTNVGYFENFIRGNWLHKRTVDCIGLIKGYCWFTPAAGEVGYAINGMPDIDSDYMYYNADNKGTLDTMPETPGLAVWYPGHIGIYIGGGKVIEAKGTRIGVVETDLIYGDWSHWIQIPYIEYWDDNIAPDEPEPPEPIEPEEPAPPEPVEP